VSQSAVAERYARAIFELANEGNELAQVSEQIKTFAETLASNDELATVLGNPVLSEQTRDSIMKEVGLRVGLSPLALNAVRLVTRRRRLPALGEIATTLTRLSDEKAGILRATVTTAKALPEDYYQKLAAELERRTHRKILLERHEDPSLIAGIVTKIGDHTIDGSVKGRLAALERQLLAST
jgi:F-type H+-transporting ATPase subunit delta